jgi:hypothetical protein
VRESDAKEAARVKAASGLCAQRNPLGIAAVKVEVSTGKRSVAGLLQSSAYPFTPALHKDIRMMIAAAASAYVMSPPLPYKLDFS